ncbi:MAG: Ig-like domain-containing protein [Gemmatimonadota bacterium]
MHTSTARFRSPLDLLVLAILATSCGGADQTPTPPVTPVLSSLSVVLSTTSITMGQSTTATATGLDQQGRSIAVASVEWSSSNPSIATVTTSGLVSGVSAGTAVIAASQGAISGSQTIQVTSTLPVASIVLSPLAGALIPGGTQQFTTSLTDAFGNQLLDRSVSWTSSTPSVAVVSGNGLVTAVAPGTSTISAMSEGRSATAQIVVVAASASITLASAGQSIAFLSSPTFRETLKLESGAQYLIAVVNTTPSAALRSDFQLTAAFAGGPAPDRVADVPSSSPAPSRIGGEFAIDDSQRKLVEQRGRLERHLTILEENRQLFAARTRPKAAWAKVRGAPGRSIPVFRAVSQSIGAVNRVYVRNGRASSCTSVDSIGARTVAVGQHVIVLADTNTTTWSAAFRPDSAFYETFASEFDQLTWPHILANIGNPLAFDASLSGIGKVTVTFTPALNNYAGGSAGGGSVVAFVNGCDFFPFAASGAEADFSNETEMFYSWVPSASGYGVADWKNAVRATAAHEMKHIVSFADRIINDSDAFEEIWLEEGLAQESADIWGRRFNDTAWLGHAGFLQTVACEINLGANAPCDAKSDKPINLLSSHLPFFFEYLQSESDANSEGLGVDTPANYGAGWAFARWATDQFAGSNEGAFIKSLVNEPRLTGLANLSLHTGQSVPQLLVYWNLASAIFQLPAYTAEDRRVTIPSFNFADIFNFGQTRLTCSGKPCGLFTATGVPVFPTQPIPIDGSSFSRTVTGVPGTSASFFLLSGTSTGIESMQLLSVSGSELSGNSGFRVAILRVR